MLITAFYGGAKYAQMYFYVAAFDDFVKDEVKFAPTRESTDKEHLNEHITDAAEQYGMHLDTKGINIEKQHFESEGSYIDTLRVDVSYSAELDLNVYKPHIQFHTTASVTY